MPQPLGYYVVGTTNAKNSTTMLRLAHENGGTADLLKIIFLEHIDEDWSYRTQQLQAKCWGRQRQSHADITVQSARKWRSDTGAGKAHRDDGAQKRA